VSREAYEAVGGMDERVRGWGQEDSAFAHAVRTLFGPPVVLAGECVHLYHPRIGRSGRDLWPGQEAYGTNLALASEYLRAARKPERMRELIAERTA
jgi:hypothetical protein